MLIITLALCPIFHYHQIFATQKCSPWAFSANVPPNDTQQCICNLQDIFYKFLCNDRRLTIGTCLTRDGLNGSAVIGSCPYPINIGGEEDHVYLDFPNATTVQLNELDDLICGSLNRQGLLCSQCKPGYGPAVHAFGFTCVDCNERFSGWGLYLFLQLFPITVFYVIVIIFHVKAVSPPFISFVIFSQLYPQIERSNVFVRAQNERFWYPTLNKITQTLCEFWNLDFFRHVIPPFCVDSRLNNLQTLWLDFISAYYPLLLIAFSYTAIELHARNFKPVVLFWRPFHKCCVRIRRGLDPKSSIVNAFATFLVLSINKIIFISAQSVYYTTIYYVDARKGRHVVLYYEPSISVEDHYVTNLYAIPVVNQFLFAVLPTTLLCLYPTRIFRKVLKCFRLSQSTSLLIFLDLFQGHFKDGTSGTRDFRALSGLYIILEATIAWSFFSTEDRRLDPGHAQHYLTAVLFLTVMVFSTLRPYKKEWDNHLTVFNLVLMQTVTFGFMSILEVQSPGSIQSTFVILNIIVLVPHIVLYSYAVYKVTKNLGINKCLKTVVRVCIARIRSTKVFQFTKRTDYEQVNGNNFEEFLPDRMENPQYYQ